MVPKGWKKLELQEVAEFKSGGTPSRERPEFWNGTVPWFSAKDLKQLYLESSIETLTENGASNGTTVVAPETVLILVRGMTLNKDVPIGITRRKSAFNQDVKALSAKGGTDPLFLALSLIGIKSKLLSLVDHAGHGTGRLSTDLLSSVPLLFPPPEEQRKISRVADAFERAIDQHSDVLTELDRRKRALKQQLLTGKRRFKEFAKEKWRNVSLGTVLLESTQRNQGKLAREHVMAVNKTLGMIPMKVETIAESIDRYKMVRSDWFAYNPMRINIGSIARWKGDTDALVSPDYVVFRCADDAILPDYLDHLRRSSLWETFVTSAGNGSVRVRIYFDDLAEMPIKLPSLREQSKIADVLNSADREIRLLRHQLDKLKLQKKGLMQKLLTGKVRVKS